MNKFIQWIKRKIRKKKCKVHFDSDSFQIKDYKVASVHKIKENISYNQELDFYISTNYDTYLLRLIKSSEECVVIYPAKDDGVIYIVSKLIFDKDMIFDSIDKILNSLREVYGFPKLKNPDSPIEFYIKEEENMKKYLWEENGYYAKNCTDKPLTDEMVAEAEKKLGYKLPQSYIDLMKSQNGGKLIKNYWVNEYAKSNEVDIIGLECFYSIGSEKSNSLFGEFGNEFWFTEWEYPRDVGVIIADTESGGHHMIYLDYRECGKEGEPKVSVCFQESDYRMQVLANNFEEFLSMLVSEAEIEQDI